MRTLIKLFIGLLIFAPLVHAEDGVPPTYCTDVDGVVKGTCTKFIFPNGAITQSGTTVTIVATDAATADSLATNGANCPAGTYPKGVDEADNAEACTAIQTGDINWPTVTNSELSKSGINWSSITNYNSGKMLRATTANGVNWDDVTAVFAPAAVTNDCSTADCVATATCPAGKHVIIALTSALVNTCDVSPTTCTSYGAVGGTSVSVTENSIANQASVYVVCD